MILVGLVVLVLIGAYLGQVLGFTIVAVLAPLGLLLVWCFGYVDSRFRHWLDRRNKDRPSQK
jgi:cell division protein FtsW (lipid II flippase)